MAVESAGTVVWPTAEDYEEALVSAPCAGPGVAPLEWVRVRSDSLRPAGVLLPGAVAFHVYAARRVVTMVCLTDPRSAVRGLGSEADVIRRLELDRWPGAGPGPEAWYEEGIAVAGRWWPVLIVPIGFGLGQVAVERVEEVPLGREVQLQDAQRRLWPGPAHGWRPGPVVMAVLLVATALSLAGYLVWGR